jgi:hypothetical protein
VTLENNRTKVIAARAPYWIGPEAAGKQAGISHDTLCRLEQSGAAPIRAEPATVEKLLTCFGQHGWLYNPRNLVQN